MSVLLVSIFTRPPRESIPLFLMWYRIATLSYAGIVALSGLQSINIAVFFTILTYNLCLLGNHNKVIEWLKRYPLLISVDILVACLAEYTGGNYGNPYMLYTFSPLFLGGFVYGYLGSFAIASVLSILISLIDCMHNGAFNPIVHGEHIFTTIIEIFFITFVMAFLGELLKELDEVKQSKDFLNLEFEKTMNTLRTSLSFAQLSERERQIIELTSKGKTISEISGSLDLSINTIKTYLKRANQKLDTCSKQQVISEALRQHHDI